MWLKRTLALAAAGILDMLVFVGLVALTDDGQLSFACCAFLMLVAGMAILREP